MFTSWSVSIIAIVTCQSRSKKTIRSCAAVGAASPAGAVTELPLLFFATACHTSFGFAA